MKKKKRFVKALSMGLAASMMFSSLTVFADQNSSESSKVTADVSSRYTVSIPKSIALSVDERTKVGTGSYKVSAEGDIEYGKSVYIVPQSQFDLVNGENSVVTTVSQTKTEWSWEDLAGEIQYGDGSLVANGLTAGSWEGYFFFNIEMAESNGDISAPADKDFNIDLSEDGDVDAGFFQLGQGQSGQVRLALGSEDVTSSVSYTSSNERITVSDKGVINTENAVGGDESLITATYTVTSDVARTTKTLSATFTVQVIGITFDKETVQVSPGDTVVVNANILPGSVEGTVRWTLNGLYFNTVGNEITINVADDAVPGNYALVASYGGTTATLNIQVVSGPVINGVIDGGEYIGSTTITVGDGNTVTVNGKPMDLDENNSFTLNTDGSYTIVVTGNGTSITYVITVVHAHIYVDGFCSICGSKDPNYVVPEHTHRYGERGVCPTCKERVPGLYTASGGWLCDWQTLVDAGFDVEKDYTVYSSDSNKPNYYLNNNCQYAINKPGINPNQVKCIVVLDDSITRIGDFAFYQGGYTTSVDMLAGIDIPDSVQYIGYGAFENDRYLESIHIPKSVKILRSKVDAFVNTTAPFEGTTVSVYLENQVEFYNKDSFVVDTSTSGKEYLKIVKGGYTKSAYFCEKSGHDYVTTDSFVTEPTCTTTGEGLKKCSICDHTTSFVIPALGHDLKDDIQREGTCSWYEKYTSNCARCDYSAGLRYREGPDHNFVNNKCVDCGTLQSAGLYDDDGNLIASFEDLVSNYGFNMNTLTTDNVTSGISQKTDMLGYILSHNDSLSSVSRIVLPQSISTLGDYSLYSVKVAEVVIPNSVTDLSGNALSNLYTSKLVVGKNVSSINSFLPFVKTIAYAGVQKANYTTMLSKVIPSYLNKGMLFEDADYTRLLGVNYSLTDVVVGSDVTHILPDCFAYTNVQTVSFENPDTVLGESAFKNAKNLKSIFLPENLTYIENSAFNSCSSLSSVTIPDSVESIGMSGFASCTSLSNLVIPNSVKSIGNSSFVGCTSLSNLVIPDSVKSIGASSFSGCTSLSDLVIPDSVTTIGDKAFYNVPHITYNGSATGSPWGAKSIN